MKGLGFEPVEPLFAGVDTHRDAHTLAIVDSLGRKVASGAFAANGRGYRELEGFLRSAGEVGTVAIECCGSYGAGLRSHLGDRGFAVVEALVPGRRHALPKGKDDDIDAERAALEALRGGASEPKAMDGPAGELSWLLSARESAVRDRTAIAGHIHGLLVRSPEAFRAEYRGMSTAKVADALARTRGRDPMRTALRTLARRWLSDDRDARSLESAMRSILEESHPALLEAFGVSTVVAATIVVCAGDNPGRFRSEAAFAKFCGVCPIPASSGRTDRHRLNRGGDRRVNCAIHRIAVVRSRHDPATISYLEKKRSEGKTGKEALRCPERHIARELFGLLLHPKDAGGHRGAVLRERRLALGVSQGEVADAIGVYPTRVCEFEHGRIRYPHFAEDYAAYLNAVEDANP